MEKESNNPQFRFLFQPESADHIYYRWKIFSFLQGENDHNWRTVPFQMQVGGPVWHPPPNPNKPQVTSSHFFFLVLNVGEKKRNQKRQTKIQSNLFESNFQIF